MTNATATQQNTSAPSGVTAFGIVSLILAILLPLIGMIFGSVDGIRARSRGASERFANGVMFLAALIMVAELIVLAGWGLPHLLK